MEPKIKKKDNGIYLAKELASLWTVFFSLDLGIGFILFSQPEPLEDGLTPIQDFLILFQLNLEMLEICPGQQVSVRVHLGFGSDPRQFRRQRWHIPEEANIKKKLKIMKQATKVKIIQ